MCAYYTTIQLLVKKQTDSEGPMVQLKSSELLTSSNPGQHCGWDAFGFTLTFCLSLFFFHSLALSIFLFTLLFQDWSEHCWRYLMPFALCLCILLFLLPAYLSLSLAVTRLGKPGWHDQSWVAMVTVPLVWQQWWWQYSTRLCVLYFFFLRSVSCQAVMMSSHVCSCACECV